MYNTLKAHTKDAHTVCGRPTLKDVGRLRKNRSANFIRDILVSELIKNHATSKLSRYIYERTFMSEVIENHVTSNLPRGLYERSCEPIENHATSAKLCNVNLNDHQCKNRRRFRRDCQPSKILIRSLKHLRNKQCKLCCVNVRKQQDKTTFLYVGYGRIRQSLKKIKISS